MGVKVTIQDLVDGLSKKVGLSRRGAESFVKSFFLVIEESLDRDSYVKIKGLGTFKLIDIDSRESVDVNTNERIIIHGYRKVSFTPDSNLKERINKPFAHYETIQLKDGVQFDEEELNLQNSEATGVTMAISRKEDQMVVSLIEEDTHKEECTSEEAAETSTDVIAENVSAVELTEERVSQESSSQVEECLDAEEPSCEHIPVNGETADAMADQLAEKTISVALSETQEEPVKPLEKTDQPESSELLSVEEPVDVPEDIRHFAPSANLPYSPYIADKERRTNVRYFLGVVVFLILLCVSGITNMFYPDFFIKSQDELVEIEEEEDAKREEYSSKIDSVMFRSNPKAVAALETKQILDKIEREARDESIANNNQANLPDTVVSKNRSAVSSPPKANSTVNNVNNQVTAQVYNLPLNGYKIIGTLAEHELKDGESMIKLSIKYYGTKRLYPLIIEYNRDIFPDPNKISIGKTIKIPRLAPKE